MKTIVTFLTFIATCYGIWTVAQNNPDVKNRVSSLLDMGAFHTFEIRYNPSQIMENYRKTLLKDNKYRYLDPILEYHPYLLMEVKYTSSDHQTHEGVILWDLVDGEMVTNTRTWEKTHGFGDCINVETTPQEFKVLNVLIKKGNSSDHQTLSKDLNVSHEILQRWIESCQRKRLIVREGNHYYLHFQNPKLKTHPSTHLEHKLTTKTFKDLSPIPPRFSENQIQKIAYAAFSQNFAIRKITKVHLPVYNIVIEDNTGKRYTTHWNGINGKRMAYSPFLE